MKRKMSESNSSFSIPIKSNDDDSIYFMFFIELDNNDRNYTSIAIIMLVLLALLKMLFGYK